MTKGIGMLARLGNVVYWLYTGLAVLFGITAIAAVGFNLWDLWQHGNPEVPKEVLGAESGLRLEEVIRPPNYEGFAIAGILVVSAIVVWLMGRAARYILAGK